MTSSSHNNSDNFDQFFYQYFDQRFDQTFENLVVDYGGQEEEMPERKKRVYIERNREAGHLSLWNDYLSKAPTYPENLFRRRFRMNKPLFMHIVDRLSKEVQFFRQKKDGLGRLGLSTLQSVQHLFVSWHMILRLIRSMNTSGSVKLQLGNMWKILWKE
ncbi:hypothetical protein Bca101_058195 [Brassica carinata]